MVDKFYNSDRSAIAALVSGDYGAGWSTWYDRWDLSEDGHDSIDLAIDRRIVEYFVPYTDDGLRIRFPKEKSGELEAFLESIGYHNVFLGGVWDDFHIEEVSVGDVFWIGEYDGSETLYTSNDGHIA